MLFGKHIFIPLYNTILYMKTPNSTDINIYSLLVKTIYLKYIFFSSCEYSTLGGRESRYTEFSPNN